MLLPDPMEQDSLLIEPVTAKLAKNPTEALRGYALTSAGRAALDSGDIRWIESWVGKLDERLKKWLIARLTQEKW